LKTTRAALERLDDDRAAGLFDGEIGTSRYRRQVRSLTDRLTATQAALAALPEPGLNVSPWLDSLSVGDTGPLGPDSPWSGWSIAERREFLKLVLDRVEVIPANGIRGRGADSFRGDQRLRLVWAAQESPDADEPAGRTQPRHARWTPEGAPLDLDPASAAFMAAEAIVREAAAKAE
jgi:hypothetical protein